MVGCLHIVSKFINHQSLLGSQTTFVGTRMVRAEKHNTVRRHPSQAKRVRVCVYVCVRERVQSISTHWTSPNVPVKL